MEIKTLNEQIERLRELIRKCYATVAGKNGIVPEVGERNMENLPNAIASTHDTLEELTITQNGEYTPQEGVDGFSKVTAEFDTSSLPKARNATIKLSNDCFDDNGQWIGGEFVDFSAITNMSMFSYRLNKPKNFDNVVWNFPEESGNWTYAFESNTELTHLDFSNANKTKVTSIQNAFGSYMNKLERLDGLDKIDTSICTNFSGCISVASVLKYVDITSWDFTSATKINSMFGSCKALTSFVGNRTIDDVIQNDIKAFTNAKIGFTIGDKINQSTNIDRASLRAAINGIADLTGQTTQTLTLGSKLMEKLTEEDIAIAVSKNWTIA